jgi:hypothetical protein
MMNDRHEPQPFTGFAPPPPPEGLHAATVASARGAMARAPLRDRWREAWESRPLRLAWGAAAVALIVANLTLPVGSPLAREQAASVHPSGDEELRKALSLGDLDGLSGDVSHRMRLPGGLNLEAPRTPRAKEHTS